MENRRHSNPRTLPLLFALAGSAACLCEGLEHDAWRLTLPPDKWAFKYGRRPPRLFSVLLLLTGRVRIRGFLFAQVPLEKREGTEDEFAVEMHLYPGEYEYKFIIDGKWTADENRETTNQNGALNNVLQVTAGYY